MRVLGEFARLPARVVGEESESPDVGTPQEHHPGGRAAVRVSRGEGHRRRVDLLRLGTPDGVEKQRDRIRARHSIIMTSHAGFAIASAGDHGRQRLDVGGDPFGAGSIAVQELARVTPVQCRLVQELGTRRHECGGARRMGVSVACGIDQVEPCPRDRDVELLGVAVSRRQPLDPGGQSTKGFVAPVSRQVHDRRAARGRRDGIAPAILARTPLPAQHPQSFRLCYRRPRSPRRFCHATQPSLRIASAGTRLSTLHSIEGESTFGGSQVS